MCKHDCGVALYPPPEVGGFTATEDKSIAGNISKIHLAVDARDNSISFIVTDDVVVLPPDMRS